MKLLKKWSFLIIFITVGVLYLSYVDEWRIYAEPLSWIKGWYSHLGLGNGVVAAVGGPDVAVPSAEDDDTRRMEDVPGESGEGNADIGSAEEDGGLKDETPGTELPGADADADSDTDGMSEGGETEGVDGMSEGGETDGDGARTRREGEWPLYMQVEDDYFSDAVFIGDSRTVGLFQYGGLENIAEFYAVKGLNIYKMFEAEIVSVPDSKDKITVEEALQQNHFAKIYLMLGINEMGMGTVESFIEKYQESVEHLRELQPDAVIYLQGIIKVTTARSNQGDYINNEGIEARNEAISRLADNEKIFYLDVNPLICDETGGMEASYTGDGVHLKAKYIEIWKEYLKSHAIDFGFDEQTPYEETELE